MHIRGVDADVRRLHAQSGPNARDQVSAVCRVLNDTCKHDTALTLLFSGKAGDHHLCNDIKGGIQLALQLASAHLRHRTPEVMKAWPICQLFNGIRGLLSCMPARGADERQEMRVTLSNFANDLLAALPASSVFLHTRGGDCSMDGDLLPYSQLLLGVLRTSEAGLADLSSHKDVLKQLLSSVATSRDAPGWDIQGLANACFALGGVLQGQPQLLATSDARAASRTLAKLIDDSLHDPCQRRLWEPIDCVQARRGLQGLARASAAWTPSKTEDPAFSQVLGNLDRLQDEPLFEPARVPVTPMLIAPQGSTRSDPVPAQARGMQTPHRSAQGEKDAAWQPQPKAQPQPQPQPQPEPEPTVRDPLKPEARRTRKLPPAKPEADGARLWQRLAMKTTAKAIITEINRSEPHLLASSRASTQGLSKMLSLVAGADRQSTAAEHTMQLLLQAAKQHVDAACASDDGLPLLLTALDQALPGFESCKADITASMQAICLKLASEPSAQRSLAQICDIAASLVPLLGRGDESAAQAWQAMTEAIARLGPAQLPAGADIACIQALLGALAPASGNPGVTAFLKQLTACLDKVGVSSPSTTAIASALASIVVSLPEGSPARDAIVELMTVLARGLGESAPPMTPASIATRQGRSTLVYSLLAPSWMERSPSVDDVESVIQDNLRPPMDAAPTVISAFAAGGLEADHAQDIEIIIDDCDFLRVAPPVAEGHVQWAVDKSRDASCPWFESLPSALAALEKALDLLEDADIPDKAEVGRYDDMLGKAVTTCYLQLLRIDPDDVRAGQAQQPDAGDQHLVRRYAQGLSAAIADGTHPPFDDEQTRANLMSRLDAILSIPLEPLDRDLEGLAGPTLAEGIDDTPPRALDDVIVVLDDCLRKNDLTALAVLAAALPAMDGEHFDARQLVPFRPMIWPLLEHDEGRALLQALTRRIVQLEPGTGQLLGEEAAKGILADIACATEYVFLADAKKIAFELMDAIARKCCEKPITWPKNWWTTWELHSAPRARKFIFQLLRPQWLKGNTFQIPASASTPLSISFGFGRGLFDHEWLRTFAGSAKALDAATLGMYGAFLERKKQCKTDDERKNLLGLAVMLVLHTGTPGLGRDVLKKCHRAMIESIAAWKDPGDFVDSLPHDFKKLFAFAFGIVVAQRSVLAAATPDQQRKFKVLERKFSNDGILVPTARQVRSEFLDH